MKLEIYDDSKNYACQVITLPAIQKVEGLDNLVKVTHQGNDYLIGKESSADELYLFFPAECKIDFKFLANNNLYRHSELNVDKTKKGFFEDSGRVKALKFKGVISTGFICPVSFLGENLDYVTLGSEFNSIEGVNICSKYYTRIPGNPQAKKQRKVEEFIDGRLAPHHFDTAHLLKNTSKIKLDDYIAVTYKLHGTSARYYHTIVKKNFGVMSRIFNAVAEFFGAVIQKEEYKYVCASRKVIKSVDFQTLDDKNHWYKSGDLWTEVGKEYFDGNLNQGEAVYCEIIGKTNGGEAIQGGYTYGLQKPKLYIYRISNINPQGIEVDLSYIQMKERAVQLGIEVCPEYFYGTLVEFVSKEMGAYDKLYNFGKMTIVDINGFPEIQLNDIFYNKLLEKPSILDNSVVEEGFCVRIDRYPKPEIFKIKSKKFLEHETKMIDKEVVDIEAEQVA